MTLGFSLLKKISEDRCLRTAFAVNILAQERGKERRLEKAA
jgi:hypothetical protein